MGDWFGDDEWDLERRRRRRPSPHHMRTNVHEDLLAPGMGSGLFRSRSQGQGPAPVVNIYNRMLQDNDAAFPPSRNSPEFRGRGGRLGEDLAEDLAVLALDRRSRSRGRSDFSPGRLADWQLAQRDQEIRDLERRRAWEREEERLQLDWERKQRDAKDRAADDEKRILEKFQRQQREEKEKAEQAERDFIRKQEEKKKKEEEQYEEFLRKQKEKEEKKKKEEKEREEQLQNEMRKRLANLGYTSKTIDIMVDEEKAKKFKNEIEHKEERLELFDRTRGRNPVFPKIHRDYLAVETLKYYDLPWEYDKHNSEYIIILRDIDRRQTDVLFDHTKRLRGKLLLEAPKKEKEYAWVRRRSKSRRGNSGERRVGILKIER